ncbi:uncharacterized protein LOC119995630 [Tripterygium wilfordii]|uniref:uncharacterized protein LOC119995630 n=1 Tax=Tripterygium wilfordii TaxID=458696 RepID=UPI0018F84725|nr:uncharacterized protein LOC119995630 [Tripterygium wilfordii]
MDVPMIHLNINGGKLTGKVGVTKDAPIHHLKELIEVRMGVKAARQTLLFNDQELDNSETVESHNLTGGDTLSLVMKPLDGNPKFSIQLKSESKNDTVEVREADLVDDLRGKIGRRWLYPFVEISLVHCGKEMEDGFPLSAYLVCENSVVEVNVKMEPR